MYPLNSSVHVRACHLISLHTMPSIFINSRVLCNKFRRSKTPKFSFRIILPLKNIKNTFHCRTVKKIKKKTKFSFQHNETTENTSKVICSS